MATKTLYDRSMESSGLRLKLTWAVTSQNIVKNTSTVDVKVYLEYNTYHIIVNSGSYMEFMGQKVDIATYTSPSYTTSEWRSVFAGIKDGIVSAFKTVVNAIIKGINKVITVPFKGINTALKKIKGIEIVGVKPFDWLDTIDTPQIPELATGTVVTRATQAVIGEDGAEAVVPLEKHTEWIDKVADKVASKMDTNGGNSTLIAKLDEVINSIKSLKIYLNTGALVGGISGEMNEALGNIAFAAERGR